ncbi:MAG: hypothetical protein MUF54_18905 [Polyangiaceae bacterium]|nr:hypothetical protein [Polyangiaceae bacterium]
MLDDVQRLVSERVGAEIAARGSERKRLVDQIATMAARERTLAEEIEAASARAPHARASLLERLDQVVRVLRESQQQLCHIDAEMLALDDARREAHWAARILSDFDRMWKVATPETQGRLIGALVDWVEVNEQSGELRVQLIAASVPGAVEACA